MAQVITWVVITIIYVITAMKVLNLLGLPIGSLVAPATVLGAAPRLRRAACGAGHPRGFFIITERQYGFGDTVQIAITGSGTDAEGVIEDVTLRVTRMRNADGEVITVPNGQIVKAVNLSKDWARAVVDVPIPASADINRVNDILHRVGVDAYEDRVCGHCCSTHRP
ncbi:mechanosensitive ion channel [Rhodococcus hoagii]|nr:mechanosensitive ion channel [Prescottella equi]